VEALHMVTI